MIDFLDGNFILAIISILFVIGCFFIFTQKNLYIGLIFFSLYFLFMIFRNPIINSYIEKKSEERVSVENIQYIKNFFSIDQLSIQTSKGLYVIDRSEQMSLGKNLLLITKQSKSGKTIRKYLANICDPTKEYLVK